MTQQPTLAQDIGLLRIELAQAKDALRTAQVELKEIQAQREDDILRNVFLGDPKNMGANQGDRDRKMILCLMEDGPYQSACARLDQSLQAVGHLDAELESLIELRRDLERRSRDKLADALFAAAGVNSPTEAAIEAAGVPQ